MGAIFLVILGLAGFGFAMRALVTGEIDAVFSSLGGWGTLSSRFSRDEQPALFWCATVFYAVAGAGLAIFGAYRALAQ